MGLIFLALVHLRECNMYEFFQHEIQFFIFCLTTLFTLINPIGISPILIIMTERFSKKEKINIAKKGSLTAFITLDQLIEEFGSDVVRYFFVMRSMNSHLDFDLDIAKDQSEKNPVFYLQYAYARICNIIKQANKEKLNRNKSNDLTLLEHEDEVIMLKHMVRFPEIIDIAYENLEPQYIAN